MFLFRRRLVAFLLACACLSAGESPLKPNEIDLLRSGEVVFHEEAEQSTTATILIEATAEAVWDFINQGDNAPEYTEGMIRAQVLDRGEDYSIIEQEMKVRPIPGSFVYTIKNQLTEKFRRIDFERQSGDLKEIKGFWRLQPLDSGERTSLTYSLKLSTGFPVPKSMMRNSARKNIFDVLVKLRSHVSQGASKKP